MSDSRTQSSPTKTRRRVNRGQLKEEVQDLRRANSDARAQLAQLDAEHARLAAKHAELLEKRDALLAAHASIDERYVELAETVAQDARWREVEDERIASLRQKHQVWLKDEEARRKAQYKAARRERDEKVRYNANPLVLDSNGNWVARKEPPSKRSLRRFVRH